MSSVYLKVVAFRENRHLYTKSERKEILDGFQSEIYKQLQERTQLLFNIETKQKQEIKALKTQIKKVIKYKLINNHKVVEKFILNNHLNN